jgi:MOSC domain-containing protein YiiM
VKGRLLSVNVGRPREIEWLGRVEKTSIWKSPVTGRVPVYGVNIEGDEQASVEFHGGPHKAVYAYAREDVAWWEKELGRGLENGTFGENLTVEGLDLTAAVIGERWEIGSVVLEVAQPRIPCWKLGARLDDPAIPVHFAAAGRPGAYLRIVEEGELGAGDDIHVHGRPDHGLTVGDVARIFHQERGRANTLLVAPELAPEWREWALKRTGDPVG